MMNGLMMHNCHESSAASFFGSGIMRTRIYMRLIGSASVANLNGVNRSNLLDKV
jgi:hypothetical protein